MYSGSFSNVKVKAVSALIVITNKFKISDAIARRGYAAAAASGSGSLSLSGGQSIARVGAPNDLLKKGSESDEISWVPDPITGYYRPEKEIDAADQTRSRREDLH